MAYGVTATGFNIKPLSVIKEELETAYKSVYGEDLDVSAVSVVGQLIGNDAKKLANLWEIAEAIYNSFNPDRAEDISLDGACALLGITRLGATASEINLVFYGDLGTVIPSGNLFAQSGTLENVATVLAHTIALTNAGDITFSVNSVQNSTSYTISINGTPFVYTSDSTATDLEIITGLLDLIDAGTEPITTEDNLDGTGRIFSSTGSDNFSIVLDSKLDVEILGTIGVTRAVNLGALSFPANSVTVIVNAVTGLDAVNNLIPGSIGREIETDEELRARRSRFLISGGKATDEAIRNNLLQEVDNVTSVEVISNRTDVTDGEGRPPHSFECVVTGGIDADIAQNIWDNQPSGIQSFGTETVIVTDSQGNPQTIKFSRAIQVYITVEVDYALYSEETFPSDGEDQIKAAIIAWAAIEYNNGVDVIYQRLGIPIYSVPGVGSITIRVGKSYVISTPPAVITSADIPIAANEIALFATNRITLTEV